MDSFYHPQQPPPVRGAQELGAFRLWLKPVRRTVPALIICRVSGLEQLGQRGLTPLSFSEKDNRISNVVSH